MRSPLSAKQRDWILAARSSAVRAALRLGAGNTVGLTRDDLWALAEDGLIRAAQKFDPERGTEFVTFACKHVRGMVLSALEARRRQLAVVTLEPARTEERAQLDDFGDSIDPDAFDPFEDTDDDLALRAQNVADDGLLVLVLGHLAQSVGAAEKALIERDLLDRLTAARATLPLRFARLVQLRFYEGLRLAEVAEAMGMSLATVHRELAKAVAMLREKIEGG